MKRFGLELPDRISGKRVVREDIPRLSKTFATRIRKAIETESSPLTPWSLASPLRYSLKGARRLRVEDWRVVYTIEPPDVVLIVKIGHRKEVYET